MRKIKILLFGLKLNNMKINYTNILKKNLINVFKEVLIDIIKNGLTEGNHLYVTFKTNSKNILGIK